MRVRRLCILTASDLVQCRPTVLSHTHTRAPHTQHTPSHVIGVRTASPTSLPPPPPPHSLTPTWPLYTYAHTHTQTQRERERERDARLRTVVILSGSLGSAPPNTPPRCVTGMSSEITALLLPVHPLDKRQSPHSPHVVQWRNGLCWVYPFLWRKKPCPQDSLSVVAGHTSKQTRSSGKKVREVFSCCVCVCVCRKEAKATAVWGEQSRSLPS